MKLKNLIKLPEKEKKHYILGLTDANSKDNLIIEGSNQTLEKIGNLELELDVDKIRQVIHQLCVMESLLPSEVVVIAQTLADNFKEIIK